MVIRRNRQIIAVFMVFLMLMSVFPPMDMVSAAEADDFAGGDGTEDDPYIVVNADQLDKVREDASASYKLGADIDLSSIENWEPIPEFKGTFDGDGYTIKHLTINRPSTYYVGLFSQIGSGGEAKNLIIENAQVHGKEYVGALAGRNKRTITNVGVDGGEVTGEGDRVGGLVGDNWVNGTIQRSYATGDVTGRDRVGGLVGYNTNGTIRESYATGDVAGTSDRVGGLVGYHFSRGSVSNVFALNGSVTGFSDVGKAIGLKGVTAAFRNIYAISTMSGSGHDGYIANTITPEQAMQQATYSGFDFDSVWGIDEDETLPYLLFNPSKVKYNPDTGEWEYGSGSDNKTIPEQPELKVVDQTTSEIQLKWDKAEGAEEYVLERRVQPTTLNNVANFFNRIAAFVTASDFDEGYEEVYRGTNTSFTDTSVARGTWYDYRVKAVNESGESNFSSAEAYTYQLVTYNWFPIYDEDGNEATEYIVQRNGEEIGRTTETQYTDDKAVPGETNLYRVIPVFGDDEGDPIEIELERIVLSPSRIELNEGEEKQLKVIAHYSDGSRLDVTDEALFTSSDDKIASVNEAGIVSAHAVGEAEVTANYYEKQAEATVRVVEEPVVQLTKLSLSPSEVEMYPEDTESLTVTARYSDGSRKDVSDAVDYYSSNPAVVTVDEAGKVTAHAIGKATITATYEGETAESAIQVIPVPELTGISVNPDKVNLHPGHSKQLTVKAEYNDDTTRTVTKDATYETSDKSIAVVSDSGLVTGVNEGNVTITVTYEGKTATTEISVEEQPDLELTSISIDPSKFDLRPDHMRAIKVIANYNDNSKRDVTGEASFTSGDKNIASVSENGTVTAHAVGSTFITAEYEGETADAVVTVKELEGITLTGLKLSPSTTNLHPEGTRQLTATAVYSDDSTRRVTSEATFTSSDDSVAVVSNKGLVTAIDTGKAVIKAEYEGKTAATQVVVSEPVLKYITAFPSNIELEPNEAQQIVVLASYSDNSKETVTGQAIYQTSDETVAKVDENGKVTAVDVGYTTITVEYGDKTSIASVAVNKKTEEDPTEEDPADDPELPDVAELTGITVTPSSVKMSPDSVEELVVYAEYSNHIRRNVTKHADFKSSDESVVFAGENGLLTAIKPGDTKIIVEYKGEQAEASVTVENLPVPVQGPDFIEIAWYEVPGAAYYELLRDGDVIHTEDHEEGKVIYRYKDQPIDSNKVHHYEIIPYRGDGSKEDPIEFVSLPEPVFTTMMALDGENIRDLSSEPNGSIIIDPTLQNPFIQKINFFDTNDFINEYNTGDGWKVYDGKIDVQENGPVFARTRDPETGSVSPSRYHIFNNIKPEDDGSDDDEGSDGDEGSDNEADDDEPFTESPTLRVVSTTADSVRLEGTKIDRATDYILERKDKDGEFAEIARKGADDELIFTDSDLAEKTTYRYRLVATNGKVEAHSRVVSATTEALPAKAPERVEAKLIEQEPNGLLGILSSLFNAGKYAIEVEWTEAEVEPQRYILYRQADDGAIKQIAVINPSEDLHYVDMEIDHDTSYTYYVAALKDGDMSEKTKSNTVYVPKKPSGWIDDGEDPDDYKGKFIWVVQDGDKARVEWQPAQGNPDKYFLYRVDLSNPILKKTMGVFSGDTLEFIDDTVKSGHTYVYYIKAQYRDGIKNYFSDELASDDFTFTLEPDPNKVYTPENVTAIVNGETVKLTWDIDYDANHYFLYRKAGNDILVRFVGKLDGDIREYIDQDVEEGVEYQYFLEAAYPKGKSKRVESNKVTMK